MNEQRSVKRSGMRSLFLLSLIALVLGLLASPMAALAHPADVYLQATYITVAPTQIVVELDLSPGVLVASHVLPQLDADGDQQIGEAEGQTYVATMLRNVMLQVDGKPVALAVTEIDMPPYLNIQAGYGTIRIFTLATLTDGMTGTHHIAYTNGFAPGGAAYQVNAFVDKEASITLGTQTRDSIQQSMTMEYSIGAATPTMTATTSGANALTGTLVTATEQAQQLTAYLYAPSLSPWMLLLALALAGVLGGLHLITMIHMLTSTAMTTMTITRTHTHMITAMDIFTRICPCRKASS